MSCGRRLAGRPAARARRPAPLTEHRVLRPPRHVGWSACRVPERRRHLAVGRRRAPRRSTSISAASAGRRCPSRSMPAINSARSPRPSMGGRAPSRCAARCRGSPIATARCAPWRRARRCAGGFPSSSTPAATSPGSPTPSGDDAIEVWSAADEQTRTLVGGGLGRVLELVAAPDGSLLAGASHDGRLWVRDRRHGRAARDRSHRQRRHHRAWPSRRTPAGSPGRTRVRSRSPRSASPRSPTRRPRRSTSRHCASPTPSRRSAPTASTWRSCRRAASTRSTTPTCSTCRSPTARRPQLVTLAGDDPVAVRSRRRRTGAGSTEGRHAPPSSAPPHVDVDADGLDQRVVPFPGAGGPLLLVARRRRWLRLAARPAHRHARRRPASASTTIRRALLSSAST